MISTREKLAAGGVLLFLLLLFFSPALVLDRVLIPADILGAYAPWRTDPDFEPQNGLLADQIRQFHIQRSMAREALRDGRLPLWDPHTAGGAPLLGNGQSAVFYPFNALSYAGSLAGSFAWIALLKLLTAGFFTYLFLRRLERSSQAALLGAVSFTFSGFLIVWLNHPHTNVAVWLPALFYLGDRLAERPDRRAIAALVVVVGIQFLGGHPSTSLHVLAAALVWVIFAALARRTAEGGWRHARRVVAAFGLAVTLGALLAAVQLLPLIEYVRESSTLASRGAGPSTLWTLPLPKFLALPLLFFPRLYGSPVHPRNDFLSVLGLENFNEVSGGYVGLIGIVLALFAIGTLWRGDRRVAVLAATGLVSLGVAWDLPVASNVISALPLFKVSLNHRLLLLAAFSGACLAAFGLDCLRAAGSAKALRRLARVLAISVAFTVVGSLVAASLLHANRDRLLTIGREKMLRLFEEDPTPARRQSLEQWIGRLPRIHSGMVRAALSPLSGAVVGLALAGFFWAAAGGRLGLDPLAWVVVALALLDLGWFAWGYNPMLDRRWIYPTTPAINFLQQAREPFRVYGVNQVLIENTATAYGIDDLRGQDGINVRRIVELQRWAGSRRVGNLFEDYPYPDYRSKLMDVAGVRYVLSDVPLEDPRLRLIYDAEIKIYESVKAAPRAYAVFDARSAKSAEETRAILLDDSFDPLRSVVLAEPLGLPGADSPPSASVKVTLSGPDRVVAAARSSHAGLLVLTDIFFPGWKAFVDGAPAPILRANHAFRAVRLPAGEHRIEFRYEPLSVRIGAWLSAGALFLTGVLAWSHRSLKLRKSG